MTRVLVTGLTSNPGGVETVVLSFVRRLQGPIEFDFWVNADVVAFQEELEALGCRVFHGARYSRHPVKAHRQLAAFIREQADLYDVLWSNKSMCANVDDLATAKRAGIARRIIHAHNSRDRFTGAVGRVKAMQHRRNMAGLRTLATDYWACSLGAAGYFFAGPQHELLSYRLIRNAVDPALFEFNAAARQRLRLELGVGESVPVVGFVGRLQFQKHPELAIDALRAFRTVHPSAVLVMVGDGDLRAACEARATEAELSDEVRILGVRSDTAEWYSSFDVLVMPSRFEGLPLVPVEAQTASLPVIASEGVPRDVAFTDLVHFVSVDAGPDVWAQALSSALDAVVARNPMAQAVAIGGYDIATESARVSQLLGCVE